jgi:hypothetical protein
MGESAAAAAAAAAAAVGAGAVSVCICRGLKLLYVSEMVHWPANRFFNLAALVGAFQALHGRP